MRSNIRRWRKNDGIVLPEPTSLAGFQVDPDLWRTSNGEVFLFREGYEDDPNRMFIFATETNLVILSRCRVWFVDGTFKVNFLT